MKGAAVIFGAVAVLSATSVYAETPANGMIRRQLKKGGRGGGKKGASNKGGCADPAKAVVGLLDCLAAEDAECAAAKYGPGFLRIHNEEDTVPFDGTSCVVSTTVD